MVKEEFDDFSDEPPSDEELEEKESAPATRPKGRPVGSVKKPQEIQQSGKYENRYASFHQPQADGVIDKVTNKPIAIDLWDMLSIIKNDIEEIKRALVG